MFPSMTGWLVIWGIVAPLAAGGGMWLTMRVHESVIVDAAIKAEGAKQLGRCQARLAEQIATLTANTMSGVGEAGAAADAVVPAPAMQSEIIARCKGSRACRDRGRLP